jgi:putative membrane protein
MYGQYQHGMGGGWWALMIIGMVIFWAIFVAGAVALIRYYRSGREGSAPQSPKSSAIAILQERFARGEMSEEEYSRRMRMLKDES